MTARRTKHPAPRIGFAGAGAAGSAMAKNAAAAGFVISGFLTKNARTAAAAARRIQKSSGGAPKCYKNYSELARGSDWIAVAVPDRALEEAAAGLAPFVTKNNLIFHLSGAVGVEPLAACAKSGASTASFHPLQTFADRVGGAAKVPGAFVAIEGDARSERLLLNFAKKLKMRPFLLKASNRPLYHASAVMASNFVVVLYHWAVETFVKSTGLPSGVAARALWPLFSGTGDNLKNIGLPAALSGPVARGDARTILRHLKNIKNPRDRALYCKLSARAVEIAVEKGGISKKEAKILADILSERRKN